MAPVAPTPRIQDLAAKTPPQTTQPDKDRDQENNKIAASTDDNEDRIKKKEVSNKEELNKHKESKEDLEPAEKDMQEKSQEKKESEKEKEVKRLERDDSVFRKEDEREPSGEAEVLLRLHRHGVLVVHRLYLLVECLLCSLSLVSLSGQCLNLLWPCSV